MGTAAQENEAVNLRTLHAEATDSCDPELSQAGEEGGEARRGLEPYSPAHTDTAVGGALLCPGRADFSCSGRWPVL